ncbi:acyl-CoA thioesterase [Streptomyces sp. p1417]|uniref:Acyl-CoA thioesterase n=1 Tax=Streptomyces typhae TaxID=2681492 RepID=A0A6L6X8Q4_9ACTN|nr:thioesterase family protein [Streptomyces typhae]MVO90234.1 acyl-CoA thioesterase [Streptomyces typhae]
MHTYTYSCPLRWADADTYGHVNNALYLRYMEEARTRMFQQVLLADAAERRWHSFVVSRAAVEYRVPLLYREDPVDVCVRVAQRRSVQFDLAYEIRDAQHVYAEGTTTIVAYNLDTRRPRRLTGTELTFLDRYTTP